jgi:hypothetical protein
MDDDNQQDDGISLSGYAKMTYTVAGEFVSNDWDDDCPSDTMSFTFTSVIPNHSWGKVHTPERIVSPGEALGMDLARIARSVRHYMADWEDVVKGFEREMREPD